jgi:hypothetical protein
MTRVKPGLKRHVDDVDDRLDDLWLTTKDTMSSDADELSDDFSDE